MMETFIEVVSPTFVLLYSIWCIGAVTVALTDWEVGKIYIMKTLGLGLFPSVGFSCLLGFVFSYFGS